MLTNLPHRVSICTYSRTVYEGGCYSSTVITNSEEWANVTRINMSNDIGNLKDQQINFYNVTMRYNTSVTNKNFIYFDGKKLKINAVSDPTNRQTYLKLSCEEEVDNV